MVTPITEEPTIPIRTVAAGGVGEDAEGGCNN